MTGVAQEPGDRNSFFSYGKEIDCKPIILPDLPVASLFTANGTLGTNHPEKIDVPFNKGFFVFPDIGVCVIEW